MAIVSLGKVKTLLGKTDNDDDARIAALIPQLEKEYLNIRNKPFDEGTRLTIEVSSGLGADEEITVTIGNYAAVGATAQGWEYDIDLRAGDTADIIARRIATQIKPTSYYIIHLSTVNSTTAEMHVIDRFPDVMETYSVLDFTVDASTAITTTIAKMQTFYPDGSENTIAQMINHKLTDSAGVQSESLGDYSVTYTEAGAAGYPRSITSGIKRFVVMK